MKTLQAVGYFVAAMCVAVGTLQAQTSGASAPAAAAELSGVTAELNQLVETIKGKLKAGVRSEEGLAEEMKRFDAIVAAHPNEKTDEVAQVLLMKAMLYLDVFQNMEKGSEVLKRIKTEFPQTEIAAKMDAVLQAIDQRQQSEKLKDALKAGVVFPDFSETGIDGKPLSISKFKGKIVLVDFWATWCGPCVAELPNVLEAYKKFHDRGFEIVGISLDKDEAKLKDFIAKNAMTWPQYFDGKGWDSKLGRQYGIDSIPATYLLDRDGKIVAKGLRGPALSAEIEKLLAK